MQTDIQAVKNDGVYPVFETRAVLNKAETEKTGRPKYTDVEFVTIHIAGDNKTVQEHKVTDNDRQRWPTLYQHFKSTGKTPVDGMPLKEWPLLTASQIATLNYISVHTVEQLAGLDDQGLQSYGMGARELQTQAKAFLEVSADSGEGYAKIAGENKRLMDDNALLKLQIEDLDKKLTALTEKDNQRPTLTTKKK